MLNKLHWKHVVAVGGVVLSLTLPYLFMTNEYILVEVEEDEPDTLIPEDPQEDTTHDL